MKTLPQRSTSAKGFTLLELLVVIAIIAILAALTFGGVRVAQQSAAKNRTLAVLEAIKLGLEEYKEKNGEYPAPSDPGSTTSAGGRDVRVGSARMLYQALTGDGDSAIQLATGTGSGSDGEITDEESKFTINGNLPKTMVVKTGTDCYLVDGWSRPIQYVKGGSVDAINATYDLWSFGNVDKGVLTYDAEGRRNADSTATYIKNW